MKKLNNLSYQQDKLRKLIERIDEKIGSLDALQLELLCEAEETMSYWDQVSYEREASYVKEFKQELILINNELINIERGIVGEEK